MKKYVCTTLLFVLSIYRLYSQTVDCTIRGELVVSNTFKYAFLYNSNTKKTSKALIIANHFLLLTQKNCKDSISIGRIYFGVDSSRTFDDVLKERSNGLIDYRTVIIEDMDVKISNEIRYAKVEGGGLNRDLDDMDKCTELKEFESYFPKHPNSKISIFYLENLLNLRNIPRFANLIDYDLCFRALSERLRNSEEGKKLFKEIYGN